MRLPQNWEGPTLASIWNAATWVIDRDVEGNARATRGDDRNRLDSMLFGSRADRVEEVRAVIEVVLRDGTVEKMDVAEAVSHGIDNAQIGRSILEQMLADAE